MAKKPLNSDCEKDNSLSAFSPRNERKKGRCLLVLPEFFGNICFQIFCNIGKCAYFCRGAFSFLKGTKRRLQEHPQPRSQGSLICIPTWGILEHHHGFPGNAYMKGLQGGLVARGISRTPPHSHEGHRRAQCILWGGWALPESHLHQRSPRVHGSSWQWAGSSRPLCKPWARELVVL